MPVITANGWWGWLYLVAGVIIKKMVRMGTTQLTRATL
jgi:hypothetical protein